MRPALAWGLGAIGWGVGASASAADCTVHGQVALGGHPLGATVIYAPGPGSPADPAALDLAEVRQFGKQFAPRSLVIARGTSVAFPNRDHIFHHLYSPGPNDRFEMHQHAGGERPTRVFDVPGEVIVRCNIHAVMEMWVLVLENETYTRADRTGAFTLDVPAGTRTVRVWEAAHGEAVVPVACAAGATVEIAPTLRRRPGAPGTDYVDQ